MEVAVPDTDAVDAVVDLWVDLASGQREFGSHIFSEENRAAIRESVLRHVVADELLVVRDESTLSGFVMFAVESQAYEQDVARGLIRNIYVVPERRGEGLGTALLAGAEERLADSGVDTVALEVMAPNDDARRFYRRHGYDPHRIELEKSVESDTH